MALPDRIKIIIQECGLNQKQFAQKINVTDSYISKLLRGESGMSSTTALLIEEICGYSKNWILNGIEPKLTHDTAHKELTPLKKNTCRN